MKLCVEHVPLEGNEKKIVVLSKNVREPLIK